MPSPRRVIESQVLPILPVAIVAVAIVAVVAAARWRRRRARLGTNVHAPCEPNLLVALCVANELLAHHWGQPSRT